MLNVYVFIKCTCNYEHFFFQTCKKEKFNIVLAIHILLIESQNMENVIKTHHVKDYVYSALIPSYKHNIFLFDHII